MLDHALQLESFTPSTHYIRINIQVIITFMYTFKLFSTPALLYTRPCTPLPALLSSCTKYLRCKGTSSTIYYTHIQVILHALHSFTIWRARGPAHHALHSDSFTLAPSTHSVKALHSPSACSVDIPPSTFCVKALHSQSTCGARPYYICTTRYNTH